MALITTAALTSSPSLHKYGELCFCINFEIAQISEGPSKWNFCDLVRQVFQVGTVRFRLEHAPSQLRRNLLLSILRNSIIGIEVYADDMHPNPWWRRLHLPDFLSQCRIRQAFLQSLRQLPERMRNAQQKQRGDRKQATYEHPPKYRALFRSLQETRLTVARHCLIVPI